MTVIRSLLAATLVALTLHPAPAAEPAPALAGDLLKAADLTAWTFRGGDNAKGKSHWQLVGDVTLQPGKPQELIAEPGTGTLLNGGDGHGVDLLTRGEHGDCILEADFNVPKGSNSGIYFHGQYEVQILDSFGKKDAELKFGDCGGVYNTSPPRTNATKAPGEWQHYVIHFRAPRFADGKKVADARFDRVELNGVVIQENVSVKGPTTSALGGAEKPTGPLMLQGDHGPVAFRKMTVKSLTGEK